MSRPDNELREFAATHIAHEIQMLVRLPTLRERLTGLVDNAVYEAWLIHARLLYEFIRNVHNKHQTAIARDYLATWRVPQDAPILRSVANEQVAHLSWARRPAGRGPNEAVVVAALGSEFLAFYGALPSDRKAWFPFIPANFPLATSGI